MLGLVGFALGRNINDNNVQLLPYFYMVGNLLL